MEFANQFQKKTVVSVETHEAYNEGLLEPTIGNVSLVAVIFFVGEILITKSGIPILEMGINHLVLFLIIVLVATFKGYLDKKKKIMLRGEY
jgi:hypothetical protein